MFNLKLSAIIESGRGIIALGLRDNFPAWNTLIVRLGANLVVLGARRVQTVGTVAGSAAADDQPRAASASCRSRPNALIHPGSELMH